MDVAKKEIESIPFKPQYNHVQKFMKDNEKHEEIARIAIERSEENIEDMIAICGDLSFSIPSKKKEKNATISYNKYLVTRLCHGDGVSFVHFHGPYFGWQSEVDAMSNLTFFADGVILSCAVGIDGLHCRTSTHDIRVPWSDEFYKRLREERGSETFKDVKNISCSKINTGINHVKWFCTVDFKDGKGSYKNYFDEVNFEHSRLENELEPYSVLENVEGKPPKHTYYAKYYNHVYDDSDDVACVVMQAKKNSKRLLTCFKRSW